LIQSRLHLHHGNVIHDRNQLVKLRLGFERRPVFTNLLVPQVSIMSVDVKIATRFPEAVGASKGTAECSTIDAGR
jgi:hypothetical protein